MSKTHCHKFECKQCVDVQHSPSYVNLYKNIPLSFYFLLFYIIIVDFLSNLLSSITQNLPTREGEWGPTHTFSKISERQPATSQGGLTDLEESTNAHFCMHGMSQTSMIDLCDYDRGERVYHPPYPESAASFAPWFLPMNVCHTLLLHLLKKFTGADGMYSDVILTRAIGDHLQPFRLILRKIWEKPIVAASLHTMWAVWSSPETL